MALPPIQYFRKEDFPDLAKEKWTDSLFSKLNELSRQAQYGLDRNISISQNVAGFWWDGIVGAFDPYPGVIYPFAEHAAIPVITVKGATAIQGFPFTIQNKIVPKVIKGVFVAQAHDATDSTRQSLPAMVSGVAWEAQGDNVKIYGINGMVLGRVYKTKLLLLSE